MNDTFYCKDCFYKNIRDPNSSLYQSEYGKEFREKKLKSAKVGYKASKIIWDKYRDPNSELYNTEKAIEFRRKESEKCKKIVERTNKMIWEDGSKKLQERCKSGLKNGYKSVLKAWEKDKFGNYVNNDESSINIRENAKANVGMKYLHCKICKKITLHNGKTCCLCFPEVQPKHCLYERNENNEIIGVYCKNHLELIKDFFDFEVTGYFKINNELVTKDINEAIKAKEKRSKSYTCIRKGI